MIGKRVSFLYSNSSACPVQEITSRPCRWLDILVIERNFVLCRLGSVCAKHVTDETNELSYLVDACEVNFCHFLPLINSLRHQFHWPSASTDINFRFIFLSTASPKQ